MIISNGTVLGAQLDTLADRTPIFSDANYYGGNAIELLGQWTAYSAIYKHQLWPNLIIRKLAMSTARMPFEVKIQVDATTLQPEAGPVTSLMLRPNPRMSGFQLWQWTSSMWDIYGEAFWLKLRDLKGVVRELLPIHPSNITIRRNADGSLTYLYTAGSRTVERLEIAEDDIVPFVSFNPDTHNRGLSNMESLRMTLLNEDAARRGMVSFWRRGARPAFILSTDKTLSDPAQARFKKTFDSKNAGADQFGGSVVLEEGMKPQIIQLNAEEMQYIESRKLNREEVAASYDVPPPVVGILDHATFSNITEQLRSQYRDTMAPRFEYMESVIDHHLIPDFYNPGEVVTRFNMDEVLRGDFETRATAVVGLRNSGIGTGNELRNMFGWAPDSDPAMDKVFANAALVELGSVPRVMPATSTDGDIIPTPVAPPYPKPQKAIESKATRSLMGRLGRLKANKPETKTALIAEHQKQLTGFFDTQRKAVKDALGKKDAGVFTASDWDDELSGILEPLALATSKTIGSQTATDLDGTYDGSSIEPWIKANAKTSAKNINETTGEALAALMADNGGSGDDDDDDDPDQDVDDYFDGEGAARAQQISLSRVITLAGLAALVAASQNGAVDKTWNVTADDPRESHAEMDGETVPIDANFSNGMNAPGDWSGGVDEVAGCTCELSFSKGTSS